MKTELSDISPTQKELKIEIEADAIKPVYQKVASKYARLAEVPGFRKGYAPVEVVKARFKDQIFNETLREVLPDHVTQALEEHKLNPLREPELHFEDIENAKLDGSQSVHFHVHVEVMPEIPMPEYKGLEATRRTRPVPDTEIEEVINERLKVQASLVPLDDHKAENGDTIIADLNGIFVGDEKAEPIKVDEIEITLGDERIEKGFNENLLGVQPDETKTFQVEYPEDFTSPGLAGKTVEYTAFIKAVGRIELPAADDEWAKSLEEGFESIADVRKKLREDMEYVAKIDADNKVRSELVDALVGKYEFEVPAALKDSQAKGLVNNFAQNMMQQGMDPNQAQKDFWQMVYNQMLPQAERDVRGAMLLDKIAEAENVEVTDADVDAELEMMAANSRTTVEEVRSHLQKHGGEANIGERLRSRKAVEALMSHAKITDGEWIDEARQQAEAAEKAAAEAAEKGDGGDETQTEEKKPKAKKTAVPDDKPKKAKSTDKEKPAAKKKAASDDEAKEAE